MIRFFDILLSLLGLLILFPLILFFSLLLRFTGEKKIFFYQERIGYKEKKFKLIKFATMLENSPNIGTKNITLLHDQRVLPVGKFLRKYKINEITQLFNILKGDMTMVGPRPLTKDIFNMYDSKTKKILTKVKPGLTGVASIFFRDEEIFFLKKHDIKLYKKLITPYKAKLEKWFVKNKNLKIYFVCILITLIIIFFDIKNPLKLFFNDLPKPKNFFK